MGEIDTKPIESVQVAISLFGERKDDSPTKNEVSIAYICIKILRYLNLVEELKSDCSSGIVTEAIVSWLLISYIGSVWQYFSKVKNYFQNYKTAFERMNNFLKVFLCNSCILAPIDFEHKHF